MSISRNHLERSAAGRGFILMDVTRVTVMRYQRKLDGRSWNPAFRWSRREAPLIQIQVDSGVFGVGEAWSQYTETENVLAHLGRSIEQHLLGRTITDGAGIREISQSIFAAEGDPTMNAACASAVDIALWDAFARHHGLPLWKALGGESDVAHVYASGGLYRDGTSPSDVGQEMRDYVENGFRHIKMKVGALSLKDDLIRLQAVRSAVGKDVSIWVDAVNQLTLESAPSWCDALLNQNVTAIQAPVDPADIATMAVVNQSLPVVASEAEFRHHVFEQLLDQDAVSYLQFCLGLVGGFGAATAIDIVAKERGIPTTTMCFSTAILQSASLHFAAAHSNVATAEYHQFHDNLSALLPSSYSNVVDGIVRLGPTHGLGLSTLIPGPQHDGGTVSVYRHLH
jgi:L-alanine-DL-glutamate epimerase-like enolase superfamily enzyme